MAEVESHTWTCSRCGRRVPRRAEVCHCGATRAQAEEAPIAPLAAPRPKVPAPTRLPPVPADVKALVAGGLLVLVAGFFWLVFGPRRAPTTPAVLGYVDAGPPPAHPSPRPQPPFRLPWWR